MDAAVQEVGTLGLGTGRGVHLRVQSCVDPSIKIWITTHCTTSGVPCMPSGSRLSCALPDLAWASAGQGPG